MSDNSIQAVFDYHQATKHGYYRYAAGPGYLDWDSQPNPFRRYEGARMIQLEKTPPTDEPRYDDAFLCYPSLRPVESPNSQNSEPQE